MPDHIRVDYDELANISAAFSAQAEAIGEMERAVQNSMNTLQGGGWIGEGANAFYDEMETLVLPAIQQLHQALDETSHVVNEVAQKMEEAESESSTYFAMQT